MKDLEISKELLSEVLKKEIREFVIEKNELRYILKDDINNIPELYFINIYELPHKCKEWALDKKRYVLETRIVREYDLCSDVFYKELSFCRVSHIDKPDVLIGLKCENTEPEAIIKACEWILKEQNNGLCS